MTARRCTLAAIAAALLLAGCTGIAGRNLVEPSGPRGEDASGQTSGGARPAVFRAGAARVEITPHPGMSMGGYSVEAKIARGFLTRLFARSFYFEDSGRQGCALVSVDVWAVSLGLTDRVNELLAADPLTRHLRRDRVIVAATHTHHGPANFDGERFWNHFASSERGFDRDLFGFLAARIARSIKDAVRAARPARLVLRSGTVAGLARNRSLEPFLLDAENRAAWDGPVPPAGAPERLAAERAAADPSLAVIDCVDEGSGETFGRLGFLAVHPTATGLRTEVYSADLLGVAAHLLESPSGAIVGFFNGAEGDVRADTRRRDAAEAFRLGRLLADAVQRLPEPGLDVGGPIESRYERVPISDQPVRGESGRRTAARAMVGVATIGGASDGATTLQATGFVAGVKGRKSARQGSKRFGLDLAGLDLAILPAILDILSPQSDYPDLHQLILLNVGKLTLASLPGEFTTTLGRRVRRAVTGGLKASEDDPPPLLIGLAGGYLFYVTTAEEYEAQHYEGASTLYGPDCAELFEERYARLAARPPVAAVAADREVAWSHVPGEHLDRSFEQAIPPLPSAADGLENVLVDEDGRTQRDGPSISWSEPRPPWPVAADRPLPWPLVAVEADDGTGWKPAADAAGRPVDNRGFQLVTVVSRLDEKTVQWTAWLNPDGPTRRALESRSLRLVVRAHDGARIVGRAFRLSAESR